MPTLTLTPVRRGLLAVAAAAVAWGAGGAAADVLFRSGIGPVAVSFWRFAIAAAALAAQRLRGSGPARITAGRRTAVLTGVALAVYQTAYFGAVQYAGLALGTLIALGASPVLVSAGAHLMFAERPTRRGAVAIACALAGLVLLVAHPGSGPRTLLGVLLALVSAVGYSAVTLWARRTGAATAGATTWGAGALILLPIALVQGLWPKTGQPLEFTGWLIFLGIVPSLLAYRWYFAGLKTVPGATAAVLVLLEPATAAFLAVLLGEQITTTLVVGSVLLLAAIATLARDHPEHA
ncbi:drug/metabolite transporter, DME family [Streptomyces sp. DvalAA-14]|uniref:DMT family transporter n=1 Tax=unclassified Streptomyces TaxID=2593676 RepID=UPI00081B9148|nr:MULTISPECIES: EamA family transporter [unclassified Streptomyces]MYS21726.1 EamA family transporter [Streptomyces sp. SID4948]SCD99734.1 drug/metabolite transporter, DME family [Streptomyces sp. DvalAA-14]